ncbi:hypothetical protein SAMN06295888_11089 [Desulfonatronum zhilinae]|nr:hypothetical protein SAMN06295888_11089 [Desulfonatronum zhilinae]
MIIQDQQEHALERRRTIRLRRSSLLKVNLEKIDRPSIKLAEEQDDFEQSFALVHEEYVNAGYVHADGSVSLHYNIFSLLPQTTTFLFREYRRVISTVTQIGDSTFFGLPMDALYGAELNRLRSRKRRIAEISSLATHSSNRWEYFFVYLSRAILRYSMYTGVNDLCIMVNPKHVSFYKTLFLFEDFGPERFYAEVNAPAVALRLNLDLIGQRSRQAYANFAFESNLHSFFCDESGKYAEIVFNTCVPLRKPMSEETFAFFIRLRTDILEILDGRQAKFLSSFYPGLRDLITADVRANMQ